MLLEWLALLGYGYLLFVTVRNSQLSTLLKDKRQQHLFFGSAASLFCLWLFKTGIYPGLNVHFLWLTACSLLLGLRWALLASSIALLGVTAVGIESWSMLGINGLLGLAAPLGASYLVYNLSFHKLPRHFFVYIFVCAFLTGAFAIAVKMVLLSGYFLLTGTYSSGILFDNYLILLVLLVFPEAMLNGMTMVLLIIYKPEWVHSFHDKFYIDDK